MLTVHCFNFNNYFCLINRGNLQRKKPSGLPKPIHFVKDKIKDPFSILFHLKINVPNVHECKPSQSFREVGDKDS